MHLAPTDPSTPSGSSRLIAGRLLNAGSWLALFMVLALAICSRRPDVISRAQFYAEDGKIFYAQAHEWGFLHSLITPHGGYFQTIQRLVAGAAQFLPLENAPLFLNLVAIAIQATPALFLLSPRTKNLGPHYVRAALALFDIGIPRVAELHGDIAGAHFHFAVLMFLVLVAIPPKTILGRAFDLLVLVVGSLSGPFCILLLPAAALIFVRRKQNWTAWLVAVLVIGSTMQALSLTVSSSRQQSVAGLGATFPLFVHIMARQVFLPLYAGAGSLYSLIRGTNAILIADCILTAAGFTFFIYAFVKGPAELQAMVLFAVIMLASSLAFPLASTARRQWELLAVAGTVPRYWYLPHLSIMATIVWLYARFKSTAARRILGFLLVEVAITVAWHWRYAPMPDLHFSEYVRDFNRLPAGVRFEIPIFPPGWEMYLTKANSDSAAAFGAVHQPLSGHVDTLDGLLVPATNSQQLPVHINNSSSGVRLAGWLATNLDNNARVMDEVFAEISGTVVRCSKVQRPDLVILLNVSQLEQAGFDCRISPELVGLGPQTLNVFGYTKSDHGFRRYPEAVYIYNNHNVNGN